MGDEWYRHSTWWAIKTQLTNKLTVKANEVNQSIKSGQQNHDQIQADAGRQVIVTSARNDFGQHNGCLKEFLKEYSLWMRPML